MKPLSLISILLSVLFLSSCGQSRFSQKKYLNLKKIEASKESDSNDQVEFKDEVELPQVDSVSSQVSSGLVNERVPLVENKPQSEKPSTQVNEFEEPFNTVIPEVKAIEAPFHLTTNNSENKRKERGPDKLDIDYILCIIIVVLYTILCVFLGVLELFTVGLWLILILIALLAIAIVILGIVTIRKGKKRLKKRGKSVKDWIMGVLVLVVGIYGIVGVGVVLLMSLLSAIGLV